MKTSRRISFAAVSLTPFLLILISVTATNDDPLVRISNYKQWSRVTQELTPQIFTIDPATLGG
jgi:hypothetical protein